MLLDQELHGDCKSVLVAIDALVRDAAERFGTDWFQQQQAECQSRLAQLAYQRRDFAEAQALFESAAATHRRRAQAYPDNLQIAGHAALAQLRLGWAFVRASRAAEAEPVLAVAIAELRRLSALDPSVLPWRNGLVAAAQQLAELAFQRGDHAAARTHYGDAIAAEQDLPASPEHERSLAILRQGLAEACTQDGDAGAALAPVRAAVAALRALVVAAPQDRYVARLLATALANQARHELAAGHAAVVEATVQEALRVLAPLSGVVDAEAAAVFATEAMAHIVLGRCLFDAGARDRARNEVAAAREALARSPAASAKMPAQFGRMLDRLARDLD